MKIIPRKTIEQGEQIPRFYLPVKRLDYSMQYECYHIILAPMVLIVYLLKNMLLNFWFDCIGVNEDFILFWKAKQKLFSLTISSPIMLTKERRKPIDVRMNLVHDWTGILSFQDFAEDCHVCGCPPRRQVIGMVVDEVMHERKMIKKIVWFKRLFNWF